ncbi:transcription-repair coupling factor [Flavobacteriaceae bacterium]|nr:transcription-repair coupling factor [Flavobacteriaceae bacterium]
MIKSITILMIFVTMKKGVKPPYFTQDNKSLNLQKLQTSIDKSESNIILKGLYGSSKSFLINSLFSNSNKNIYWILENKESAGYHFNDLEGFITENQLYFFPSSYNRENDFKKTNTQSIFLRTELIRNLSSNSNKNLIVTYPEAVFEKIIIKKDIKKRFLKIKTEDIMSLESFNEKLFDLEFNREDFVVEPGDFSVRGGIVDVFSYSNNKPYRIEFFGDEIESIRTFDIETQISNNTLKSVEILGDLENKEIDYQRDTIFNFIRDNSIIITENIELLKDSLSNSFEKLISNNKGKNELNNLFYNGESIEKDLNKFSVIELNKIRSKNIHTQFNISPQPAFNKKFKLLIENISQFFKKEYSVKIFCSSKTQIKRFKDIFELNNIDFDPILVEKAIYKGFIDHDRKEVCYSDHEIFERYHKFKIKSGFEVKKRVNLNELKQLEIGDYVTHIDHGVGVFGGLKKIDVNGKIQEAIKLTYGERDTLYVSIHLIHKICKYNGKDGTKPKIYKLGSGAWKKIKLKAKKRVKEVAFNLIEAYAKRKLKKGFQYGADSSMQHELEASFIYEDTPDQLTSTIDIKKDMESLQPMDRLICGDVGFGKTEIAIRAAFKAIDNNKQVAILVPTTVLAFQHFKTFSKRLKDFPVTVDYLNRFRATKEKNLIIEELNEGKIDIIIGTHQLVNNKINFKNLGLLIVDEEQKFGVSVKEKIRSLKENIDVLTLTATPIPRTLQYSLMSARDLSIINTPPQNRFPIESSVISFNEEIIKDAINFEINRGGQVFFVHNRIENIQEIRALISRLVPSAEIAIVHGRLEGKKLEKSMLDFIEGKYDVLVSTTIIESGLDVPNANTMFINNSQNFGLSDLHQMRGRVGRSNKKAFCYFITAPLLSMTQEARKRIEAIEQHTELGSGFHIAMKDLEIRGAGDLLGAEQSGFINDIGFETYQKILREAVEELKNKEFESLFENEVDNTFKVSNFKIDTDLEILFPDNYINNVKVRLNQYQKLSTIYCLEELNKFIIELEDRFGKLPSQSIDLIKTIELKLLAIQNGFEKLILKNEKLICQFISSKDDKFYSSGEFGKILQTIQNNQNLCQLKEKKSINGERLLLVFQNINSIEKAINCLKIF